MASQTAISCEDNSSDLEDYQQQQQQQQKQQQQQQTKIPSSRHEYQSADPSNGEQKTLLTSDDYTEQSNVSQGPFEGNKYIF